MNTDTNNLKPSTTVQLVRMVDNPLKGADWVRGCAAGGGTVDLATGQVCGDGRISVKINHQAKRFTVGQLQQMQIEVRRPLSASERSKLPSWCNDKFVAI